MLGQLFVLQVLAGYLMNIYDKVGKGDVMTGGLLLLGTMLINEGATNVGQVLPSPSSQSFQAFAESHS